MSHHFIDLTNVKLFYGFYMTIEIMTFTFFNFILLEKLLKHIHLAMRIHYKFVNSSEKNHYICVVVFLNRNIYTLNTKYFYDQQIIR